MSQSAVYFGGSRYWSLELGIIPQVMQAVINADHLVHVGCQYGADAHVIACTPAASLRVFAVEPQSSAPAHVLACPHVVYSAGGTSAPMPARYLLRSIAAFQGCSEAVFFSPGTGSLAVARECIKAGLPVYAFQQEPPARIPSTAGSWQVSSFFGFSCWQWSAPTQISLF